MARNSFILNLMRLRNPLTYFPLNYLFGRQCSNILYSGMPDSPLKEGVVTISFDNDFDEDYAAIPELLDVLDEFQIKTTFAVIGKFVEKYPDQHKDILDRGHYLINHTYSHPDNPTWNPDQHFHNLTIEQQRHEIQGCHKAVESILNYKMIGYRAPHFGRQYTRNIYKILPELDYQFSSSIKCVRSAHQWMPYEEEGGIFEFPISTCPYHPLQTFDSYHSLRQGKHKAGNAFIQLFEELIHFAASNNAYINVYFDARDFAGKNIKNFRELLRTIKESGVQPVQYEDLLKLIR